jgi:hypothetical protein
MNKTLMHMMVVAGTLFSAGAQAITIDGNLNDWGVNHSNWKPTTGILSKDEDQTGSGSYYLNPGWGGQAYDAEAMYVTWDTNNLYIAIATGHNPNTANNPSGNSFGAGDIAIDFGINGSWDYGIELLGSSTTTKGHVYSGVNWNYGLWKPDGSYVGSLNGNTATADHAHPTSILSGTDLSTNAAKTGVVAYTDPLHGENNYGANASDLHYFYEVMVPIAAFGNDWGTGAQFNIHWTQNCANDSISVTGHYSAPDLAQVPEPGTLALLPLGLLGLVALRRRKTA